MVDSNKIDAPTDDGDVIAAPSPMVFISHDSRDAELAEAFSKLLKSVSAGMIKTFRSSDKKGTDGIAFGEEWYKRLMTQLQSTSDVVCLFTERSLDRPWILFEAGVAKGKLDTPVVGVALDVSLSQVSAGPFYQFQNMDDSDEDLRKLVHQLAERVPGLELDSDVVASQVAAFKEAKAAIASSMSSTGGKKAKVEDSEERSLAKLAEEMKTLPSRVAERLMNEGDPLRRRRMNRFHPMMFEELVNMTDDAGDPVFILMAASMIRDDVPWLYELAMEAYRAVKDGDTNDIEREIARFRWVSKRLMRGPFMEKFEFDRKQHHMIVMGFPQMLEHFLHMALEEKTASLKAKPRPSPRRKKPGG